MSDERSKRAPTTRHGRSWLAAQADISLQHERALSELRTEVADLSISLAERIVEKNLDRTTQMQLVDSFIEEVGSN